MGRQLDALHGLLEPMLVLAVEREPQPSTEWGREVVGGVDEEPAETLVARPYRHRGKRAAQVVVGRLGLPAVIDDAPPSSGGEIAHPQDHCAPARRGCAAPLAEHL